MLVKNQDIDYATGKVTDRWTRILHAKNAGGSRLVLPETAGFTTVEKSALPGRSTPRRLWSRSLPRKLEVGSPWEYKIVVKNTGRSTWTEDRVTLVSCDGPADREPIVGKLNKDVKPGEQVVVAVFFPAADMAGYVSHACRLHNGQSGWFGPRCAVSVNVADSRAASKTYAFRESGHIRLKWFAPATPGAMTGYEVHPHRRLPQAIGPDCFRTRHGLPRRRSPEKPRHYYYHVVAIDRDGRKSRPSNEDNAKALGKPRFWDSEIVDHDLPVRIQAGQTHLATVTIRNTGSRAWDLTRPGSEFRLSLNAMQQWGCQDEARLPAIALKKTVVKPGGNTIQVSFPYSGLSPSSFENHWLLSMDLAGKERVYFGTPLLVQTLVTAP